MTMQCALLAAAKVNMWACQHPLLGVQALTPLTIGRSSAKASLLGALWGFGHSTGQLILGLLMVVRILHHAGGRECASHL